MESDLQKRVATLEEGHIEMKKMFKEAFPNGDHIGHRSYHEVVKEDLAERKRLRAAITEKSVAGIIWACIVWLGAAVWHQIKSYWP